jgi:hypothetical protein
VVNFPLLGKPGGEFSGGSCGQVYEQAREVKPWINVMGPADARKLARMAAVQQPRGLPTTRIRGFRPRETRTRHLIPLPVLPSACLDRVGVPEGGSRG